MDCFNVTRLAAAVNQARMVPHPEYDASRTPAQYAAASGKSLRRSFEQFTYRHLLKDLSKHFPPQQVQQSLRFIALVRKEFSQNPRAYEHFFAALQEYENNR